MVERLAFPDKLFIPVIRDLVNRQSFSRGSLVQSYQPPTFQQFIKIIESLIIMSQFQSTLCRDIIHFRQTNHINTANLSRRTRIFVIVQHIRIRQFIQLPVFSHVIIRVPCAPTIIIPSPVNLVQLLNIVTHFKRICRLGIV